MAGVEVHREHRGGWSSSLICRLTFDLGKRKFWQACCSGGYLGSFDALGMQVGECKRHLHEPVEQLVLADQRALFLRLCYSLLQVAAVTVLRAERMNELLAQQTRMAARLGVQVRLHEEVKLCLRAVSVHEADYIGVRQLLQKLGLLLGAPEFLLVE